jgi:hypothetical protein
LDLAGLGYPAGVSITLPEARRSRVPAVFAVLGILAGLFAGGTYYYTQIYTKESGASPEEVVDDFLTAVFAAQPDLAEVDALICASWDPAAAVERATSQIPREATAGWQDIQRLSTAEHRVVVEATITLTPFADEEPSDFIGWTFNLVDEDGWRVCEAREIV